ncbi:MAG: histidinol dehydrogenase [Campylobacterales bacterium]
MKVVNSSDEGFERFFAELLQRGSSDMEDASEIVKKTIANVRKDGDRALVEDVKRFDRWEPSAFASLRITSEEIDEAYENLDISTKEALELAFRRIESYHRKQLPKSWFDYEVNGTILGQKVTAVDRAGLYIPGGKAAYPSSLLMNAIPAIVAGVNEIVVCTPTPQNAPNELLLAACKICNIKEIYKVGGASAVAALAYGTESIKKVDVITGPGNIFVAAAKKEVYGSVNIDMIAGPSEIGILADNSSNPRLLAIDMLSQAEHDEMASSILITTSSKRAKQTSEAIEDELKKLNRVAIASKSIENRGAIIVTKTMDEAIELMNEIAPEHLEVCVDEPFSLLPKIKHAGAIFLGKNTPEALGDYVAGPNHTLPTGGSAKFYSPLSVENFLKKSSILSFSQDGLEEVADACECIAGLEGLEAHRKSVAYRRS